MQFPHSLLFLLPLSAVASCDSPSQCEFTPSVNATEINYPGSTEAPTYNASTVYPYNLTLLSSVPIATICTSSTGNRTEELSCARKYIDAIDEQLAFLYARRLGYAAVAGASKFATNASLNDPSRNEVVAEGMAKRVAKYGATEDAGRVLGGEGCMIYAALEYEVDNIQEGCDKDFEEQVERICT